MKTHFAYSALFFAFYLLFCIQTAHYVWFSWFWSHFFLHYVYSGSCTITSKAKINIFWKAKINVFWNFFFTPLAPSGPLHSKIFQKTLILAFEANSALSSKNETKIVKITHSATGRYFYLVELPMLRPFWRAIDWFDCILPARSIVIGGC